MRCEFCGGEIPFEVTQCPNCGAPCKYIEREQKNLTKETTIIFEKSEKNLKKYSDDVPMGSADISFLQKQELFTEDVNEDVNSAGCLKWSVIIIAIVAIIIFIILFSN